MKSMTGIGKALVENEEWKVSTLIKSLNAKGLDVFIKSNYNLSPIELNIRKMVRDFVVRGTINIQIDITPKKPEFPIDKEQVSISVNIIKLLAKELGLNLSDDVVFQTAWRHAEKFIEELNPSLEEAVYSSLREALMDLVKSREEEGKHLKEDIEARLLKIEENIAQIEERKEEVLSSVKERVLEKARELGLSESHPTVLNEITLILSKMDIEEELTRFKTHLKRFKDLINSKEDVGRRLDFLLQEMHREITTLGNKMPEFSKLVVDIKTEIDRLKQQVANIE